MIQTDAQGAPLWRKSSRCDSHHCVEIALGSGEAAVRNSTAPDQRLAFTASAWQHFIAGVQSGVFIRH